MLEVGAGNGLNFAHYPSTVTTVTAVEPEPLLRQRAQESARDAAIPITVIDGLADSIPAPDNSFDAAVTSLVLCSVPNPATALAEIRRVLKPSGTLYFYEHVAANKPGLSRAQRILDATIWPRLGGGCHTARHTTDTITEAGFEITRIRRFARPSFPGDPTAPHIIGIATPS